MRKSKSVTLAAASVLVIASGWLDNVAKAQTAPVPPASGTNLNDIIVTARRQNETLQRVPLTVVPVTGQQLERLELRNVKDIGVVVPGVQLVQTGAFDYNLTLRGVTYDVFANGQPNVAFYLNDAPVDPLIALGTQFDTGQIEVLRGPQGTTRGIAAPSGAISITTHQPDMTDFGGYVDGSLETLNGRNVQGAINLPIVSDVLALRVAGVYDLNRGNDVRSVNSTADPRDRSTAIRTSLRFTPADNLEANFLWQHLRRRVTSFTPVGGTGPTTGPAVGIDPEISAFDRLSVQNTPSISRQMFDFFTGKIDYGILGHHLTYVGSYSILENPSIDETDTGNLVPGVALTQNTNIPGRTTIMTHEFRISSDHSPSKVLDYSAGVFFYQNHSNSHTNLPEEFLPGAFGGGAEPDLASYDPRYRLDIEAIVPSKRRELSFFGSATLHLGSKTELTAGFRRISYQFSQDTQIFLGNAITAIPLGYISPYLMNCGQAGLPSTYPGLCDIPVPGGGSLVQDARFNSNEKPILYNVSLSHRFTPNLMVYANTGTSYRPPNSTLGLRGDLGDSTIPDLRALVFHPSEKSTSYEVGVKSVFLNGHARVNASVFYQKFKNFVLSVPDIRYLDTTTGTGVPTIYPMQASIGAVAKGIDIDAVFNVLPGFSISPQFSYAKLTGSGKVPCNLADAQGVPIYNTGGLISLCPAGEASRQPRWNATVQSEYTHSIDATVDGFLRGLLNYYPRNPYVEPNFTAKSYALVNLFVGVRHHDGAWELTGYVKNVFNNKTLLDISPNQVNNPALALFPTLNVASNYYSGIGLTAPREFGVNLRYAFGSR